MKIKQKLLHLTNSTLSPLNIKIVKSQTKRNTKKSRNPQDMASLSRRKKPVFVNIGSGGWSHPEWHALDKLNDWYKTAQENKVDYDHDLCSSEPLPFDSNSLEAVFCSHVIEHLPNNNVQFIFEEVYRVLAPGGYFRVTCPDVKLIYNAYQRKDEFFMNRFAFHKIYSSNSITASFLHCFAAVLAEHHPYNKINKISDQVFEEIFAQYSFEEALDYFCKMIPLETQSLYPSCHCNWFHHDKVIDMLRIANFNRVWKSSFGQSHSPAMVDTKFFDTTQPWMSLYVECQK